MLARDGAGVGAEGGAPIVYKKILPVDLAGATNLVGTPYETGTRSVLQDGATPALRSDIVPALTGGLVNMLDPVQLARVGLTVERLSEKWETMDLVSVLEPEHPSDYYLLFADDNDFIAKHCRMSGHSCDSEIDNDNQVLVYRLTLPAPLQ